MSRMLERSHYESYDYDRRTRRDNLSYLNDYRYLDSLDAHREEDIQRLCRKARKQDGLAA